MSDGELASRVLLFLRCCKQFHDDAAMREFPAEALTLLHHDVVFNEPESLPYGGTYEGRGGFVELDMRATAFWDFEETVPSEFIENRSMVVAVNHVRGRIRPTGEFVEMPFVSIWRFDETLIRSVDVFPFDTAAVLRAAAPS